MLSFNYYHVGQQAHLSNSGRDPRAVNAIKTNTVLNLSNMMTKQEHGIAVSVAQLLHPDHQPVRAPTPFIKTPSSTIPRISHDQGVVLVGIIIITSLPKLCPYM
jgi:hypothetical protein